MNSLETKILAYRVEEMEKFDISGDWIKDNETFAITDYMDKHFNKYNLF